MAVKEAESGIAAERRDRTAVCSRAGRIGRFCSANALAYNQVAMAKVEHTEEDWFSFGVVVSFPGVLVTCKVTCINVLGKLLIKMICLKVLSIIDSRCLSLVLPTPAAGRTMTSIAASSGSSSRRWTSIGPLTAPIIVYPFCEKVADPSV